MKTRAADPANCKNTVMALNCPVDLARKIDQICGSFEAMPRKIVEDCKSVNNATLMSVGVMRA